LDSDHWLIGLGGSVGDLELVGWFVVEPMNHLSNPIRRRREKFRDHHPDVVDGPNHAYVRGQNRALGRTPPLLDDHFGVIAVIALA